MQKSNHTHSSHEGVHTNDRSHETNETKRATDKKAGEYDVIREKHEKTQLGDNSLRDNAELTPKQQTTELTTTRGRTTETDTPRESSEATQEHDHHELTTGHDTADTATPRELNKTEQEHDRHELTTDHDTANTPTTHEVTEAPTITRDTVEPTNIKEKPEKDKELEDTKQNFEDRMTKMDRRQDRLNLINTLSQGFAHLAESSAGTVKEGIQ